MDLRRIDENNLSELRDIGVETPWKLTRKQQLFAIAYVKNGEDSHKALIEAGYATKKSAIKQHAYDLRNNPLISKFISNIRQTLMGKKMLNAEWVLKRHEKVVNDFIPLSDEVRCDPIEAKAAQNSLDGICKIQGLYAKEPESDKSSQQAAIEDAKKVARENAKEF